MHMPMPMRHPVMSQSRYNVPMPEEYVAHDKRTGHEIVVRGDFPDHPQDRIRIARTTNLFARLMATILATENESERREAFVAIETQLEMADALIRHDNEEVQRLLQETMQKVEEMRREAASSIIVPEAGGFGGGGAGPAGIPGGGGRIRMP